MPAELFRQVKVTRSSACDLIPKRIHDKGKPVERRGRKTTGL
jgi:hypothetical protein